MINFLSGPRILVNHFISLLLMCASSVAWNCNSDKNIDNNKREISETQLKESLIKANKAFLEAERESINNYIKRHQLELEESETGLRYKINEVGSGVMSKPGDVVKISHRIFLLDGTLCYDSDSTGMLEFMVEKADIPNGLHEAVQLMRKEDKAILIMPAHLAYGLTGDNDQIPIASALVCYIKLEEIIPGKKN